MAREQAFRERLRIVGGLFAGFGKRLPGVPVGLVEIGVLALAIYETLAGAGIPHHTGARDARELAPLPRRKKGRAGIGGKKESSRKAAFFYASSSITGQ